MLGGIHQPGRHATTTAAATENGAVYAAAATPTTWVPGGAGGQAYVPTILLYVP